MNAMGNDIRTGARTGDAPDGAAAREADLRLATLMRSLAHITPAVAHDLRAPINAMVFNVEILKETIASGKGAEPGGRERQLRYVSVLKEELSRLHREMEIYIAHISPRGDRTEVLDLRELIQELAVLLTGPTRKQQVQVHIEMPDDGVPVEANRFLLRQALLHLSVVALEGLPRESSLDILLERVNGEACLTIHGLLPGEEPGQEPDPEDETLQALSSSPALTSQLNVAREILAEQGGRLKSGSPRVHEIELTLAGTKE